MEWKGLKLKVTRPVSRIKKYKMRYMRRYIYEIIMSYN